MSPFRSVQSRPMTPSEQVTAQPLSLPLWAWPPPLLSKEILAMHVAVIGDASLASGMAFEP